MVSTPRPAVTLLGVFAVATPAPGWSAPLIGVNLAATPYYSAELVFTDVAQHFAPWFGQEDGQPYAQSDPAGVRFAPSGTPTFIRGDHSAGSLWDRPAGSIGGLHEVTWAGKGDFQWLHGSDVLERGDNRLLVDLGAPAPVTGNDRVLFRLNSIDEADPFRDLQVRPVDAAGAVNQSTFQGAFLDRWSGQGSFRYMDWSRTNNSTIQTWDQRPQTTDASQSGDGGVALEYQIEHANTTGSQPWFTIPHLADDDYVRNAATLIRDQLDEGLSARIEYSNEVWNTVFDQNAYAVSEAAEEGGLGGINEYFDGIRWYSQRSVEVFETFEEVFTENDPDGMDRLVRVMSGQAASTFVGREALAFEDAYKHVDALAIGPYFGDVPDTEPGFNGTAPTADFWRNATHTERVAMVEERLQVAFEHMEAHAALLALDDLEGDRPFGDIELFAYEGGQHFVGHPRLWSDAEFVEIMADLSRMDEMEDFYFRYLQKWEEIGGEDFLLFNALSDFDQYGSWGLLEYEGQDILDTPKLRGVERFLASSQAVPEPASLVAAAALAPLLTRRRPRA